MPKITAAAVVLMLAAASTGAASHAIAKPIPYSTALGLHPRRAQRLPVRKADRPAGRRRAGVPPTRHRARGQPTARAQA